MNAIRGYSRLAPLIVVALMLVVAGCGQISSIQEALQDSGSEDADPTTNHEPGTDPTPTGATSSGNNGRIAYVAGDEEATGIFSSSPQGGDERRITDDGAIYALSYSPDGSKVAFTIDRDIYIANVDGTEPTRLTEGEIDSYPIFSPDGEYIAFVRGGRVGTEGEIYTMKADGSEQEQLTDGPGQLEAKGAPAWNPREMEIAFPATYDAGSNDDDTIYTVDFPDGDNLVQVTESDDPENEYAPAYSPDGNTIVYASGEEIYYAGASDIYTVAADGSERGDATRLTDSDRNLEPVFSPDGERIAYASTSSVLGYESYDIFTIDSETGNDKFNVTETGDRGESSPSWGGQGSLGWGSQGSSEDNGGYSDPGGNNGSSNDSGGSRPEGNSGGSSNEQLLEDEQTQEETQEVSQAVGDYYRAAGAERWSYTYDHLSSDTQSVVSENVWVNRSQWYWDKRPVIHDILSVESYSNSDGRFAEASIRTSGIKDGEVVDGTVTFVLEEDGWKYLPSDSNIEWLMPDATFQEFVEAKEGSERRQPLGLEIQ